MSLVFASFCFVLWRSRYSEHDLLHLCYRFVNGDSKRGNHWTRLGLYIWFASLHYRHVKDTKGCSIATSLSQRMAWSILIPPFYWWRDVSWNYAYLFFLFKLIDYRSFMRAYWGFPFYVNYLYLSQHLCFLLCFLRHYFTLCSVFSVVRLCSSGQENLAEKESQIFTFICFPGIACIPVFGS